MSDLDAEGVDKLFGAFSCQTLTSLYCANAIRNLLELEIIAYNFFGSSRLDILHIVPLCPKFQTYGKNLCLGAALQDVCTGLG